MTHPNQAALDAALMNAVKNNKPLNVSSAIEQGANVNAKYKYGLAPLHYAAQYGLTECAQLLITHLDTVQKTILSSTHS